MLKVFSQHLSSWDLSSITRTGDGSSTSLVRILSGTRSEHELIYFDFDSRHKLGSIVRCLSLASLIQALSH